MMTHRALPHLIQKRRIIYLVAGFVLAVMLLMLTASAWSSNNSSVRGMVYHDMNHNGKRDPGERGVPNVYVRVGVYSDAWSHEFYTGDDGTYAPVAMSPGDYYVRLLVPKCYKPTSPTEHGVWLMEHQVILGLNFGIAPIPHCNPNAPMPMPMPKPMPPMQGGKPGQGGMGGGMAGHDGGTGGQNNMGGMSGQNNMGGMSGQSNMGGQSGHSNMGGQSGQANMGGQSGMAGPSNKTQTYVVEKGDTLSGIAEAYGVTIKSIMDLNGLTDPHHIYVGQVLKIPGSGMSSSDQMSAPSKPNEDMASAPAPAHGQIYVVQPGDYLGKIAKAHGTTVQEIAKLNMLANLDLLFVGQELRMP